jgi:hypothetical protein
VRECLYVVTVTLCLACCSCHTPSSLSSDLRQANQDAYCVQRGKSKLSEDTKLSRVEAFYSWRIHTCVQVEVDTTSQNWSFELRDVSAGFFQPPKFTHTAEIPLTLSHYDGARWASAHATGYWQATDPSKDKQLASTIVAEINCSKDRDEQICRESDAALFMGLLQPQTEEFQVSSWTPNGIVADDDDNSSSCGIKHRLSIDFDSKSVIVTDYPTKVSSSENCKGFQNANSYSLHGGSIALIGQDQVFYCDKDGADSAVLAKVAQMNGDVANAKFTD